MDREKRRIEFPGALYHVISRGNKKADLFLDEKDYNVFLKKLAELKQESDFILYCYCLMPNHFHFLLEAGQEPLSKIMQRLLTFYAVYFNARYKKTGHVFEGKYKAIICEKEEYLIKLVQYIHLNPIRAGLAKKVDDYKWSSHPSYMGYVQSKIIATDKLFCFIDGSVSGGYRVYKSIIYGDYDGYLDELKEAFKKSYKENILGTDEFITSFKNENKVLDDLENSKNLKQKTLSEILDEIVSENNIPMEIVLSINKFPEANKVRKIFYYKAAKEYGYMVTEIANFINRDISIISKGVREMKKDILVVRKAK